MNNLKQIRQFIDLFTEWMGKITAWATLMTVLMTFLVVILRYGTYGYSIALQESILYFHALVFMAGAAYTLKHNEHVRVDIFYQRFSDNTKAYINLFGTIFLLMPISLFIFWISIDYVINSWGFKCLQIEYNATGCGLADFFPLAEIWKGEGSREAGGLPFVHILKTLILVLPLFLFLQAISIIIQAILTLKKESK